MKTYLNLLMVAGIASFTLSACGAKEAINSIRPPSGKNGYQVITTPDLSSTNIRDVSLKINGKTYRVGDKIDIATLHQNTVHNQSYELTAQKVGNKGEIKESGTARIYKNKYSAVLAAHVDKETDNKVSRNVDKFRVLTVQGDATAMDKLPTQGSYLYDGLAFTGKDTSGRLSYFVDFDTRQGSGSILGLGQYGKVDLEKGSIAGLKAGGAIQGKVGIEGIAKNGNSTSGSYKLGFFGPKGEEIAGQAQLKINNQDVNIGFGGRKSPDARRN